MRALHDDLDDLTGGLRQQLVRQLRDRGFLTSLGLAAAFARVPRHAFLADHAFWLPEAPARRHRLAQDDPAEALSLVYSDRPLAVRGAADGSIASSSTSPSLIAHMLELLGVASGERVLEIGTGTGYAAALLAELVGAGGAVETVEIDRELAGTATRALRSHGYHRSSVVPGDATRIPLAPARFERVLASVATNTIPESWLDTLRPGGTLVVSWPLAWRGLALLIRKHGDDGATGRFVRNQGRTCLPLIGGSIRSEVVVPARGRPHHSHGELAPFGPRSVLDPEVTPGLHVLAKWAVPGLVCLVFPAESEEQVVAQFVDGGPDELSVIIDSTGAIRATDDGLSLVRRLRDTYGLWCAAGRPAESEYRWTWRPGEALLTLPDGTVLGRQASGGR